MNNGRIYIVDVIITGNFSGVAFRIAFHLAIGVTSAGMKTILLAMFEAILPDGAGLFIGGDRAEVDGGDDDDAHEKHCYKLVGHIFFPLITLVSTLCFGFFSVFLLLFDR